MKKCTKCQKIKDDTHFGPDKRNLSGLQSRCRDCRNKDYTHNKKRYYAIERKKCTKYGIGLGTLRRYGLKLGLAVYDKHNRKCVECSNENDLTIHHLDNKGRNYTEQGLKPNNDIDNLILICRRCHGSIHGKQSWSKRRK